MTEAEAISKLPDGDAFQSYLNLFQLLRGLELSPREALTYCLERACDMPHILSLRYFTLRFNEQHPDIPQALPPFQKVLA